MKKKIGKEQETYDAIEERIFKLNVNIREVQDMTRQIHNADHKRPKKKQSSFLQEKLMNQILKNKDMFKLKHKAHEVVDSSTT